MVDSSGERPSAQTDELPEFTQEALAYLQNQVKELARHAHLLGDSSDQSALQAPRDNLKRLRNTLVLLEKPATVFVVEELLAMLESAQLGQLTDPRVVHEVLVLAAEQLQWQVTRMQRDHERDDALSLLMLVNDSRACRDEGLLSDILVQIAGIALPKWTPSAGSRLTMHKADQSLWQVQRQAWLVHVEKRHPGLAKRLLDWWRSRPDEAAFCTHLQKLAGEIEALGEFCKNRQFLQHQLPMFQCAAAIARALGRGELENGPAVRSLFVQLERHLHHSNMVAQAEDLVPSDLQRNLLFYVAQIQSDTATLAELRGRFRLDQFRLPLDKDFVAPTTTIGAAYRLLRAIRHNLTSETQRLRKALSSDDLMPALPRQELLKLRIRLLRLNPVMVLMGARTVLGSLREITQLLSDLDDRERTESSSNSESRPGVVPEESATVPIAGVESANDARVVPRPTDSQSRLLAALQALDSHLEQHARDSVRRPLPKSAPESISQQEVVVQMAVDACLREARDGLHRIARQIDTMLSAARPLDDENCHLIKRQLHELDLSLQILPLPNVSPLLQGLGDALTRLQMQEAQSACLLDRSGLQEPLAVLLVTLDEYLGCALYADLDNADLLGEGAQALHEIEVLLTRLGVAGESLEALDASSLTLTLDDDLLLSTFDNTLENVFHSEFHEQVERLETEVRAALRPISHTTVRLPDERMLRTLHTMAASAQTVEAVGLTAIVQPLQRVALARQRIGGCFNAQELSHIAGLMQLLRLRLDNLASGGLVAIDNEQIAPELRAFLSSTTSIGEPESVDVPAPSSRPSLDRVFIDEAQDLLQRLRQLLQRPAIDAANRLDEALSITHTLKGSARMAGRYAIAEVAHKLEQKLQHSDTDRTLQLRSLEQGAITLAELVRQAAAHASASTIDQRETDHLETDCGYEASSAQTMGRLPVPESASGEELLDLATSVAVNQARLSEQLERLQEICRDVETTTERLRDAAQSPDGISAQVTEESVTDLAMVHQRLRGVLHRAGRDQQQSSRAAATLQQRMIHERLVRIDEYRERLLQVLSDASTATGREAELNISGGEVTLDHRLFKQLRGALEHLVRNCIVHGIEDVKERLAQGKARCGQVNLSASIDGTDLVVELADDGRGIDLAALNASLERRGELKVNTLAEVQQLLFRSGFSSIETATPVGGHGLGLAAVAAVVSSLGGGIQLATQAGEGLRVSLRVPQRIVVNKVVLVEEGGLLYALPLAQLASVMTPESQEDLPVDCRSIELGDLLHRVARPSTTKPSVQGAVVLLNVDDGPLALGVDRVLGHRELLSQAIGPQMSRLGGYAGGSVLVDGTQVLILNVEQLLTRAKTLPAPVSRTRPSEFAYSVALVVDDSLTMRLATESLMPQFGLRVRRSRDALQAMQILRQSTPHLIVLDLEMPRLDGPGLLRRLYQHCTDNCPPVIVISMRDETEVRRLLDVPIPVRFLRKPYSLNQLRDAIRATGLNLPLSPLPA